jgi:hypothetical protein
MAYNANWFQSVEKKPLPKAPTFSKTLYIDRVVSGSPAADLNLKRGDKLLSVNGKAALIEDIPALLAKSSSVKYRFFLPRESAFLEVKTNGLPLGIVTSVSSEGIVDQYKSKGEFQKEGLLSLWEREDYDHIRVACAIANKRLNKGNFVGKLTGKPKSFSFTKLMLAVCDIETGETEIGYEDLGQYSVDDAHSETSDARAVLNYYHAKRAKAEARLDNYLQLVQSAYSGYPQSERIQREAVKAGVEINPKDARVGRQIQTSQSWDVLEGGQGTQSLADILAAMSPDQILPICLMTTYRGNGPYNEALLPYIAVQPHVSDRLHPLVVLTNIAEKRKDRPHWNSNEAVAKKAKCPFNVLYGSFDEVIEVFSPRGAPEFFALNKAGEIIWTGELSADYHYWDMLNQLS